MKISITRTFWSAQIIDKMVFFLTNKQIPFVRDIIFLKLHEASDSALEEKHYELERHDESFEYIIVQKE